MASNAVKQIQQVLKNKGFDPGEIDGIWGRKTIAAVQQFQQQQGLEVDGIVGPKTSAVLFSDATAAISNNPLLPWFEEAKHLMGTKEVLGDKNNPVIMDWAKDLDIHYAGDDVPWCGLFVAHCVGTTLQQEVLPGNPLGARQWEKFGSATDPRVGAIMVFWRESLASGKGHVGFYVGEDADAYQILGGNQSDEVCLMWLSKDRFRCARWPETAASLNSKVVLKDRNEGLSVNEA
ncbi:MAG: TIGR02594 family protein [Gammaproteobacteria bacterium]|nr:MAG: TIGR02594 family protein [Gammaproteobacteria bacterium]